MNPDLALLRELRARRPDEPVPMVLMLRDERDRPDAARPAPATTPSAAGAAMATRLDALRASLAPTRRDDDLGVVETLLQVLAYEDFTAGPT